MIVRIARAKVGHCQAPTRQTPHRTSEVGRLHLYARKTRRYHPEARVPSCLIAFRALDYLLERRSSPLARFRKPAHNPRTRTLAILEAHENHEGDSHDDAESC